MLDTSRNANLNQASTRLSEVEKQKSWLLNNKYFANKEEQALQSIEAVLQKLSSYSGYEEAVLNLLRAKTWHEYQEHWWMLKVAEHLVDRRLLRQIEVDLPNGSKPDMRAEVDLEGQSVAVFIEAKSWRFHPSLIVFSSESDVPIDKRVERMVAKLLKQLPDDSLGVWAWDKMRDGFAGSYTLGSDGPKPGVEETQIINEVCVAVPQLAAVMVKALDGNLNVINWTVPSRNSKWTQSLVNQLVTILNSGTL